VATLDRRPGGAQSKTVISQAGRHPVPQRSSVPAEPGGSRQPEQPAADSRDDATDSWDDATDDWDDDDDEWPDDMWPDDEDSAVGDGAGPGRADGRAPGEGPAWPPPPWSPMAGSRPPGRRARLAAVVAVALIAAGIGAGIVLATRGLSGSPAAPVSQPTTQAPAGSGGNGTLPGGSGATSQMFVGGPVIAVSSTSITIGGPGRDITATVTSSTRFTGKVTSISGIKVGDQVTAQLTEHGGAVTAVAITDPGQLSGGSLP
jgi:hypothetical protein